MEGIHYCPTVRRNPYYRTGNSAGSIPQDPWAKHFYSQVFKFFALVFQKFHVMLDSYLFKFLVIFEPPQGQSNPIWPQYQLLLAIHGLQITQLCKMAEPNF